MTKPQADVWSELFAQRGRPRRLRHGEVLFRRGERAEHLFRVRAGAVRLERVAADGSPVTILVARAAETVAEAALFAAEYHCDARAEGSTLVDSLPTELLRHRLRSDPELAGRVIARLSEQLRELRALLELRGSRSARDRVLRYLALFRDGAAAGDVSLQTVAHQIGLRPETFYRTLARLEAAGLVTRHGRRLRLAGVPRPGLGSAGGSRRRGPKG
jgi:CRP-like cAMP-binding protein